MRRTRFADWVVCANRLRCATPIRAGAYDFLQPAVREWFLENVLYRTLKVADGMQVQRPTGPHAWAGGGARGARWLPRATPAQPPRNPRVPVAGCSTSVPTPNLTRARRHQSSALCVPLPAALPPCRRAAVPPCIVHRAHPAPHTRVRLRPRRCRCAAVPIGHMRHPPPPFFFSPQVAGR